MQQRAGLTDVAAIIDRGRIPVLTGRRHHVWVSGNWIKQWCAWMPVQDVSQQRDANMMPSDKNWRMKLVFSKFEKR